MFKNYHRHIYFFSLSLLVVSLPLSVFLLSVAQIILLVNWLAENNFREKWERAKKNKGVFAFITIYIVHIIGMFYSTDWNYGLHDLKIKLPLLVLPIIIGTTNPLSKQEFKRILLLFCGGLLISTIISTGKLFGLWGAEVMDVRDISIFISHIRLALMVNMAIFILAWFVSESRTISSKLGFSLILIWFVLFLVILKSLTGLIIFGVLCLFFCIRYAFKSSNLMLKWFTVVGVSMLLLLGTTYFTHTLSRFYNVERVNVSELETETTNGNFYVHDITSPDFENGNLTWLYVCDKELESVWNKRSNLNYKGTDLKGQELRYTLIRYLTSKGLRKDSAGLSSLPQKDIRNIELGMANYIYSRKFSLYPRIYQLLWEVNKLKNGGNSSGHSFTQRLEYFTTSLDIIESNFWFGVGTGDVAQAFEQQYIKNNSKLDIRWRLRAHNQLLTFFLTFGLIGFLIITAALIYPAVNEKTRIKYLIILFLIVGFMSFLNEDTLETHAGISFFAFFYAFFLYNPKLNDTP